MTNEVVVRDEAQDAVTAVHINPTSMLQIAVERGASIEQLTQLMALQERYEANEAKKAFTVALNAFKANSPTIIKNKAVSFSTSRGKTEYKHATLDNISEVIGASLAQHDLSHRWDVNQKDDKITVACVLTHSKGHSERVEMTARADDSGAKNSIQAISSAVTYLQRYTLLAVTGCATKEIVDDDGAGFGKRPGEIVPMPEAQIEAYKESILAAESREEVKKIWEGAAKVCHALKDSQAHGRIKEIVTARMMDFAQPGDTI